MPVLEHLDAMRIAATPAALDALVEPDGTLALRTALDELLLIGAREADVAIEDDHAIVFQDGSWLGAWVGIDEAEVFLSRACEFELPIERPVLVQGMVAHLAVKMWLEDDRVLFVVPMATAVDFEDRYERLS